MTTLTVISVPDTLAVPDVLGVGVSQVSMWPLAAVIVTAIMLIGIALVYLRRTRRL